MPRLVQIGRLFMCLWVLFVLPSIVSVLQTGHGAPQLSIAAGFVVWSMVWIWFFVRAIGRNHAAEIVGLVCSTAILGVFALLAPEPLAVGGVLVFSFIMAGLIFPWRQAIVAIGVLTLFQFVLMNVRLEPAGQQVSSVLNSVLVGFVGVGARLLWQSYTQLAAAREQLTHLAVTEERLRFARDLHDVLGQSLSVLVLKSELVGKQLPADADESLRSEVRDIAQVSRKSLNDLRETVAGYRKPTLLTEITHARTALRAAGIGLLVENGIDPIATDQDGVLAWCLREAVTNVVKHSGATKCEVRLSRENGSAKLEVADDGRGATSLEGGSGLAGMRERVEMIGGTMSVATEGGLRLRVSVPQPA